MGPKKKQKPKTKVERARAFANKVWTYNLFKIATVGSATTGFLLFTANLANFRGAYSCGGDAKPPVAVSVERRLLASPGDGVLTSSSGPVHRFPLQVINPHDIQFKDQVLRIGVRPPTFDREFLVEPRTHDRSVAGFSAQGTSEYDLDLVTNDFIMTDLETVRLINLHSVGPRQTIDFDVYADVGRLGGVQFEAAFVPLDRVRSLVTQYRFRNDNDPVDLNFGPSGRVTFHVDDGDAGARLPLGVWEKFTVY